MPFETPVYLDTYKFKSGGDIPAAARHKIAMFLTGFIMLTPHRIAVLCAPHIVKRFHLPPSVVPLFIYKIHNPMELSSFVGTVIQVLLSALFTAIAENGDVKNNLAPQHNEGDAERSAFAFLKPTSGNSTYASGKREDAVITNCKRVASIICGWFMFFTSIFTFIFFISGDDYGHLGQFYWSVIIMAFANGIYSSFSFGVNVNAAIYAVGLPLSGFFTFVFNNCCKYLSNKYNWEDYDYTFVKLLIISTMLIQFITAAWWTMDQIFQLGNRYKKTPPLTANDGDAGSVIPNKQSIGELFGQPRGNADTSKNDKTKQAWSHWSPILMLSMSLGTVYAFYPAITPYQLMDVEDANNTDFYVQFISAIPTLVIGVLDEIDLGPGSGDGYNSKSNDPNDHGIITNKPLTNWYDDPRWNCFWIAAIPYVLCLHIFITMIHFPDGLIATFLHSRPRLLQAICVSFNFWQEILEIVGFSAAGKQSNPYGDVSGGNPTNKIAYNGHVGMVNNFLFLFTMAITMFVGDGERCLFELLYHNCGSHTLRSLIKTMLNVVNTDNIDTIKKVSNDEDVKILNDYELNGWYVDKLVYWGNLWRKDVNNIIKNAQSSATICLLLRLFYMHKLLNDDNDMILLLKELINLTKNNCFNCKISSFTLENCIKLTNHSDFNQLYNQFIIENIQKLSENHLTNYIIQTILSHQYFLNTHLEEVINRKLILYQTKEDKDIINLYSTFLCLAALPDVQSNSLRLEDSSPPEVHLFHCMELLYLLPPPLP